MLLSETRVRDVWNQTAMDEVRMAHVEACGVGGSDPRGEVSVRATRV